MSVIIASSDAANIPQPIIEYAMKRVESDGVAVSIWRRYNSINDGYDYIATPDSVDTHKELEATATCVYVYAPSSLAVDRDYFKRDERCC